MNPNFNCLDSHPDAWYDGRMAIRVRKIENVTVALCAAQTRPEPGDIYLDDAVHHALGVKFERDWLSEGMLTKAISSDSPEWALMDQLETPPETVKE